MQSCPAAFLGSWAGWLHSRGREAGYLAEGACACAWGSASPLGRPRGQEWDSECLCGCSASLMAVQGGSPPPELPLLLAATTQSWESLGLSFWALF